MSDINKGTEEQGKDIDAFLEELEKINNEFNRISTDFERNGRVTAEVAEATGGTKAATDALEVAGEEEAACASPNGATGEAIGSAEQAQAATYGVFAKIGTHRAAAKGEKQTTGAAMTNKKTRSKKKKKYIIHWGRIFLILVLLGLVGCLAVGGWVYSVVKDLPEINTSNIYSMMPENSTLYDSDGQVIETLYSSENGLRTNVDYVDMPQTLVNAFIAIEDKTFREHKGFNVVRIMGAVWDSLKGGGRIGGTSTITQQLARNLYLEDERSQRSLERKVKEAYYAIVLERTLSKEQIIEAYLNFIFLGNNSSGVQAAAQGYFSKDVSELTLAECALLASLAQLPTSRSPIQTIENSKIEDPDALDIVVRGDRFTSYYSDAYKDRQALVLRFMEEQGFISAEEREEALAYDIRAAIKPRQSLSTEISSYFADYVVEEVLEDFMEQEDLSRDDAKYRLNNGGLQIYSTLDTPMQKIAESEFANPENFPGVTGLNKDEDGNVRDSERKTILYYNVDSYFNEDGSFTLAPDEYQMNDDGSMLVFKGKRMNFYRTESGGVVDVTMEFKPLYTIDENKMFYSMAGGYVLIPAEYKSRDDDGNLLIDAQFFTDKNWFTFDGNGATISAEYTTLQPKIMQPQAAMVIYDYKEGSIKAMTGGRSISGKLLYNRATSPRQPGSSVKPISVYAAALQSGADAVSSGVQDTVRLWTAASVIDDSPLVVGNKRWPKNWYSGYRGLYTLREAVQQSVNVCAVKCFNEVGAERCVALLKKLGITSVVESGNVNDLNPAALSLGGMSVGISPLEMAVAYGAFPSQGVYTAPVSYYRVTNKNGEVIMESEAVKSQAMDKGVAYIMTDILRTTVSQGIANRAGFSGQPVAGKTGTTSDNFDAWFCGFTPYYSAALWIGNDVGIELTQGSTASAKLWSRIMSQAHEGLSYGNYPANPGNVVSATIDTKSGMLPSELSALDPRGTVKGEYFIQGTVPTETDTVHVVVTCCTDSGYLATPYCSNRAGSVRIQRPEGPTDPDVADSEYDAPVYYCPLHNLNPAIYPIDPEAVVDSSFVWDGITHGADDWVPGETDETRAPIEPDGDGEPGASTDPDPSNTEPDDSGDTPDVVTPPRPQVPDEGNQSGEPNDNENDNSESSPSGGNESPTEEGSGQVSEPVVSEEPTKPEWIP